TNTANIIRQFNSAGSWIVGYNVNAGGFGGFGSVVTYNYTPNDHAGLFSNTYDDLANYRYIETETEGDANLVYYYAISKVMQAFDFQLLLDFYGDIPYSEAL